MADGDGEACGDEAVVERNTSNPETKSNEETNGERPAGFGRTVSRTSMTFFNSDNAQHTAGKKLESLIENHKSAISNSKESPISEENEANSLLKFVLDYCVGGEFNLRSQYVIQDPFNALILLELLDFLSPEKQIELLTVWTGLLKHSIKNLQSCTKVGLIEKLLCKLPLIKNENIADKVIDLVGDLAMYSITVRELNCFFAALQRTDEMKWPPHALKLLEILKKMPEKHGPDVYFNFAGKEAASITVPPISKWPHQPGFTFVTWLQLDAAHLSPLEQQHRPHIYSFMNSRGLGYSAHFSGPMLVIQVWGKNGKKQTILVKSKFEPQMWYHVCISHTYNRFKSSEVKIFVNGQMVTAGDITMPSNKETMDKCFIGGSHTSDTTHVFKGQMSAIYVFAEPLAYNVIIALYRLGPGYKGKFKFRAELETTIPDADKKLIYDGRLAQVLLFTYNPKAVDGELCLESSPTENPMCFYHSPHALMMDGVQAVVTHSLQAAMHSLGGIQMLFPLFTQLDCLLDGTNEPEPKICSLLLSLIYDLLRGSSVCQQQMIQSQGFMIIGHLLQKSSPAHLSEKTVDILLGMARYFMATSSATGLLGGLLDHVLLEPSLWIKTPISLQSNLLSLFATGYVGGLDYAGYIRKEVGVPRLILMLRKYYSVKSLQNNTSMEEVISLRAFVLLLVKQMIMKGHGILEDELKSILVYLAVEEEEGNYMDILQLLLSVMCETPDSIIPCFDMMEGFQVFFKLLVANDEIVRICSLKILCAYIQQLNVKRKLELVEKYGFISKIGQKLYIFDITMVTYNGLFELLTARATKIISENRHASPNSEHVMYHPSVLPIIVKLLLKGRNEATASGDEEKLKNISELTSIFLSDLVLLLNCNNDNKRLLLQLMCWQDWMFSIAYFDPSTKEESKITDTVFSIIKMLLYYAIQNEKEGWRVWVDTLSILHGKVTFHATNNQVNEESGSPLQINGPQTIFDDKNIAPEYIDQETGELKDVSNTTSSSSSKDPVTEVCTKKQEPEDSTAKSPSIDVCTKGQEPEDSTAKSPSIENDPRKLFFEKLKESATAVSSSLVSTDTEDHEIKHSEKGVNDGVASSVTSHQEEKSEESISDSSSNIETVKAPEGSPVEEVEAEDSIVNKDVDTCGQEVATISHNNITEDKSTTDANEDSKPMESTSTAINNIHEDAQIKHKPNGTDSIQISQVDTNNDTETSNIEVEKLKKTEPSLENDSNVKDIRDSGGSPPEPTSKHDSADISCSSESMESTAASKSPEQGKVRPYVDIPEFTWSNPHQRLLTELLFSVEADIQVWKTHTRKVITDFVSSRENSVYIMNLCHMVSILSDSLIYCCGGLLPLLASATSKNFTNDVLEPCGGMTLDAGFSFLNRILNIVDIIAFATSMNFSAVEQHRNMSGGGVLRQCIRLVFCGAARNRVVCRQREKPLAGVGHLNAKTLKETQEAIKTLIASTKPPTDEDAVQNIPGHMTTITNPERLLQDSDIYRLRALVYREVEDNRQSQYVALVVIYLVAVLMVARYRDILDHEDVITPLERSASVSEDTDTSRDRSISDGGDEMSMQAGLTLEERIDMAFHTSASLLREILFDFSHYLSRVLVGSRGQDLISDGLGSLKSEDSTVELVMLLCSQEWQNALQRQAGTAFMDLVDEGRLLSHSTRERIVITGSEALDIMKERDNVENLKHAQFETLCTKTVIAYMAQYKTYDQFFKAKKKRNLSSATQSLEKIFDVLTSEFGAWPLPEEVLHYEYYKNDRWEDMQRRRMRMVKNPYGTSHPEATLRPGSAEVIPPEKPPPLKYHTFTKQIPSETSSDDESEIDLDVTIDEKESFQHDGSIVLTAECRVVSPGAVVPGTLAITSDSLYFTADDDCEELRKIDPHILSYNDCLNIKCSFGNIVAVFSRRYILQNKAIEVFLANRRSFMFAFATHDIIKKVIHHLPAVGIGTIYGVPKARGVSTASPRQQFLKSNMLQRWQNRDVSNFEYIMFLNTIAGRTYNDLNQYFVFPWVLQNYVTDELDLNDPSNYRDLSKPIGALNPFRLAEFVERFDSWDETGQVPPFHYGTHYSTAGFVMNWLIRLEPFASLFLSLQGGKFDHPLRTFSSIKRAWDNCQRDTSDVKELIPELFYQSEMFQNSNKFVFGDGEYRHGDGDNDEELESLSHVELPPWAESPEHFIHLHREALESEYVSSHLHKWIDLIFGYKQKGREAEHSANVFYHLTYEGSVDLDAVTDPITREALEEQIKSFGQTPQQVITTPHPPRNINDMEKEDHKSIFLSFAVTPEIPVTYVSAYTSEKNPLQAIITISCNQVFSVNKWINFGGNITSYHSLKNVQIEQDPSLESLQGKLRRQLGEPLHESVTVTSSCFTVTSDNKCIFTCGYWDKSFKCFSTESGKLIQCVFGHWDVVTCLAYSDDELTATNAIVVSGSSDATLLVWIWDHKRHTIIGSEDSSGFGATPIAICIGHKLPVTCVDINTSIGVIASGSVEGACLVHSLSGELLRCLNGPDTCQHPRLINISNEGRILVNYSTESGYMAMFSSNGKLINSLKLADQVLAVVFTKDGRFFITGGFSKSFHVWRSYDLMLLSIFPPCDGSIRCLALTPDQRCMIAGLTTGSIIAMAMDFTMWSHIGGSSNTSAIEEESTEPNMEQDMRDGTDYVKGGGEEHSELVNNISTMSVSEDNTDANLELNQVCDNEVTQESDFKMDSIDLNRKCNDIIDETRSVISLPAEEFEETYTLKTMAESISHQAADTVHVNNNDRSGGNNDPSGDNNVDEIYVSNDVSNIEASEKNVMNTSEGNDTNTSEENDMNTSKENDINASEKNNINSSEENNVNTSEENNINTSKEINVETESKNMEGESNINEINEGKNINSSNNNNNDNNTTLKTMAESVKNASDTSDTTDASSLVEKEHDKENDLDSVETSPEEISDDTQSTTPNDLDSVETSPEEIPDDTQSTTPNDLDSVETSPEEISDDTQSTTPNIPAVISCTDNVTVDDVSVTLACESVPSKSNIIDQSDVNEHVMNHVMEDVEISASSIDNQDSSDNLSAEKVETVEE